MYLEKFNFSDEPFSTAPDPMFLYRSRMHQEALDRLIAAVSLRRGINAIIGEPGLGKSTLIRTMLYGFKDSVHYAWVFNTTLNSRELFRYIMRDFGYTPKSEDLGDLVIEMYTHFIQEYENGKIPVLIIDEAQNLKPQVLEEIRQLSNLETVNKKLVQIILSGQPQLDAYLDHPSLHQLKQRISFKAVLTRMGLEDTKNYIRHRIRTAGSPREDLFTEAALSAIYDISDGVPRLINQICENALMRAASQDVLQVDSVMINELLEKGLITPASKRSYKPKERICESYETPAKPVPVHNKAGKRLPASATRDESGATDLVVSTFGEFDGVDLAALSQI